MRYHRRQCIHLLLQASLLIASCLAENLTLSINFERRAFVTDDAFLSLTLDPATLLSSTDVLIENIEKYTNMMQGLAPAYVRFGGPLCNSYDQAEVDPDVAAFESHSTLIHRWAEDAGLNVIACISPGYVAEQPEMHSSQPTRLDQLLSFWDSMGHNVSWQLGYECQTRCELSGRDLGRYVAKLRETLEAFPRYSDSLIAGPDITGYRMPQQREYLRDYLSSAGDALSAITWHPDFAGATVNGDDVSVQFDNIIAEREELYEAIGDVAGDKPLWIAESKPEDRKHGYLGALVWTRRLGNAAKLGAQVVMRQFSEFSRPTPDYWVSLLHKALVGREVLEVEVQSDESHVHFYGQCTRPSAFYEKGALTIFGVNLAPREVTARLEGFKIKTLHEYILSPDPAVGNKMFAERVLLNGEPLHLTDDTQLPDLNPEIVTDPDGLELKLASGDIGFWVIPNAKVKVCTHEEKEEEATENVAMKKSLERHPRVVLQANEEGEGDVKVKEDTHPPDSEKQELHATEERAERKNEPTKIRKQTLRNKLHRAPKKHLQRRLQRRRMKNNETSDSPNLAENPQDSDNGYSEGTEKPDNEADGDTQGALKKYKRNSLRRRIRSAAEEASAERKVRDINRAMTPISKIEGLPWLKREVTSRDVKDGKTRSEEAAAGTSNDKLDEPGIKRIEKYINLLHDLLINNKLTAQNVKNIAVHEGSTSEGRRRRDLSERFHARRRDLRRSRTDDLKNRIKQRKINRINDDKKVTSPVASELTNLDNHRSTHQDLFQQHCPRRFPRSSVRRGGPQHSVFNNQDHGRATRDVNRMSTETGWRKDSILRKRNSKIDDVRDQVNESKSKRKDVFKREGLLSPLNPRISDESSSSGFLRRDPIGGFPEGDVFITTGSSGERSGHQDYGYVEDDEDEPRSKDQQREQGSVECAEDVTWMEADGDQHSSNYEFFENINPPSAKIRENYDDLSEAEFVLGGRQQSSKDNDRNDWTAAARPLEEKLMNGVQERSIQQPIDSRGNPDDEEYRRIVNRETPGSQPGTSTPPDRLLETSTGKYDFTDYQPSDASLEATKPKPLAESKKLPSSFYQPALASSTKYEYMKNPVNDRVPYGRKKRSNLDKLQGLFFQEMIGEGADSTRVIRVIRDPKSSKKPRSRRAKRDQVAASEAEDPETRLARAVQNHTTKEDFDRIITGEVLPTMSLAGTDSDYDKGGAETTTTELNRSQRKTDDEATRTTDVVSTSATTTATLGASNVSAEGVMDPQTFFRAQSPATPSEIEETTYDTAEATPEVSSLDKESRQELVAPEPAPQATGSFEETQGVQKEIQRESTGAAEARKKTTGKRVNEREVDLKPNKEEVAEENVTTETSKRAARKTTDHPRPIRSRAKKESKEPRRSENESSPSEKRENRGEDEEKNGSKRVRCVTQDLPRSQSKGLANEKRLVKRNEQVRKLRRRLQGRRGKRLDGPARIDDERTRNVKRRDTWEKFCENNDFCRLIDRDRLFQFLIGEIEARMSDEANFNDDDNYVNEDDRDDDEDNEYLPVEFVPKRYDDLPDQTCPRQVYYPKYNSYYHFLRYPKVLEEEPATLSTSSDRRIFAIDPSAYRGGEPVLEPHEEYLDPPSGHSSGIKSQPQIPKLRDFYQALSRPVKIYEGREILQPHGDHRNREFARKTGTNDADERGNAVVLYMLDKHRQYDLPKALASLSQIYLSALNRRATEDKTASNSSSDEELETAREASPLKEAGEVRLKTGEREESDGRSNEEIEVKINGPGESNGAVEGNTDTNVPRIPNVEEETLNGGDLPNTSTPRSRRNAEGTADELRERTRLSEADARTGLNHIHAEKEEEEVDSEEVSNGQSISFYQLTRLPSDAVLFRKPKNYVASPSRNFDRRGVKESSRYVVLMPDKIEDVYPYETLGARGTKDPERPFRVSRWLDRYLPKKVTNAMIKYLKDVSSDELDYKDLLNALSDGTEETDEEVSYSLDSSEKSGERGGGKISRNAANWIDRESRKEGQQEMKSEESSEHLKMKGRIGFEKRRTFMPHPAENGKTKRQRRQAEIDQSGTNEFIPSGDTVGNKNDEYYLQRNSINEDGATDYLHFQRAGKMHDDLLEDFVKSRKKYIALAENEGNNESLENSITKSDKKSPAFVGETIPKLRGVIIDGLAEAKDPAESVEQFVDNFDENFNESSATDEETSSTNKTSGSADNPFHLAVTSLTTFFKFFTGISRNLHV